MERARAPGTLRHKTLSVYYPTLVTLGTLLSGFDALLYHSDPDEYHSLLSTTVCAPAASAPPFPSHGPTEWEPQESIDRILHDLVKLRGPRGDTLALGTKAWNNGNYYHTARPGIESALAHSPASVLRGRWWQILRSRLGDAAFRHLFLYASLFLPLGNNCFIQLCGTPISELSAPSVGPMRLKNAAKRPREEGSPRKTKRKRTNPTPMASKANRSHPAVVKLNRQRIFYGKPLVDARGKTLYGLPRDHILNKCSNGNEMPLDEGCEALLHTIFPSMAPRTSTGDTGPRGSPTRKAAMIEAMREMLTRHARTPFGALLSRCLERTKDVRLSALGLEGTESSPPELAPVPQTQVYRYLGAVLRYTFTPHLVGPSNISIILQNVRKVVCANQHSIISLHAVMQGVSVDDIGWLCVEHQQRVPASEAAKRRELGKQFIHWLFDGYIIPLLLATFYTTETADTGNHTVYYPYAAWSSATRPHLDKLANTLLEELDMDETEEALRGQFGASAVRLVPKPTGFRPIVNLGKRIKTPNAFSGSAVPGNVPSVNELLKNVQLVLTYEKNRQRNALGDILFGTNEIFPPIQSLKKELLEDNGRLPKLYFVKMDMKSAFDSVNQSKLLEVIEQLLDKNRDYCMLTHWVLLPPSSKASQGVPRKLYKNNATVMDVAQAEYGQHAKAMATESWRNAVLVDLLRPREYSRSKCMDLLRAHVQNNVWQVGTKLFRQRTGIPQGSCVSSLLCGFFYSWLAADHLAFTRRRGTRLLRYTDDFLLVSDNYDVARRFVHRMSRGFPEYGANVSASKTLLSFELAHGGQAAPVVPLRSDGAAAFPYCGFLIDTKTLDFSIDSDRMLAGPIRQSFALRKAETPGALFVSWISRQLQNRNHVAYVDTDHNALSTVYLNVFINFALTTMKVPHYFTGDLNPHRATLIHGWLTMAAEYTYTAGRARVRHAARDDRSGAEHFALRKRSFMFVALSAMRLVLMRKASRFHLVVDALRTDLNKEYRGEANSAELDDVVRRGWEIIKGARY